MTADTPDPTQAALTIQEMARQSGLSEHTLRYYERIGLITPVPRDSSSKHRRYPPAMVGLAETLACLREMGMSLDSIRRYLQLREQGAGAAARQMALFAAHKNVLEQEMAVMKRRLEYVAGKVAFWEAVETGDTVEAQAIADANCLLAKMLIRAGKEQGQEQHQERATLEEALNRKALR